ncbi:hypothetical protein MGSAQ_000783 [marine sediment metagenome]|uniref:Uncharacterized protein n=1 Tax=marine sediment metagenome TaxID=412755 RepID=A0A1B6NWK0_9ZZZZ
MILDSPGRPVRDQPAVPVVLFADLVQIEGRGAVGVVVMLTSDGRRDGGGRDGQGSTRSDQETGRLSMTRTP